MVWMIIWAGLLIVVLYSPIGSPDLYSSSQNYYQENRSIAVNAGVIQNAPKSNYASDNSSNELDIPQVSTLSKSSYSVGNYQSSTGSSHGSSYSVQGQSYQSNNSYGMGGGSNGGNSFIASGSSRSSAGSSGVVMTNGITTLSLTTDLNNTTSKQGVANNITAINGTDPGGDPTGDPIPVGDGWELLLFFSICYATFKMRSILFRQLHILSNKKNQ